MASTGPLAVSPAPRWSTCYAPHASIYFDQRGKARACCQNTGAYLGDLTRQTIREVWESATADALRSALEADDLSLGCTFCAWQFDEGNDEIVHARTYDHLRPDERRLQWPREMQFSLTNTCNLQCAMCNGEWSSSIRSQREHLPPLAKAYGDAFFTELAEFLPHLEQAKFLGGEPLLGTEPLRVLELIAELDPDERPQIAITTNGTILTPRVEHLLAELRPTVTISLDGATPDTYDAIRVGAHLPDVLANLDRFRSILGPGRVALTHCLMTSNWFEFDRLLHLAAEREIEQVFINIVRLPVAQSLYHLPEPDLSDVVRTLRSTPIALAGPLAAVWEEQVAALEHHLSALRDPETEVHFRGMLEAPAGPAPVHTSEWPWLPFAPTAPPAGDRVAGPRPDEPDHRVLARFGVDLLGTLVLEAHDDSAPIGLQALDGDHIAQLSQRLAEQYGPVPSWTYRSRTDPDEVLAVLPPSREGPDLEVLAIARRDPDGTLRGATYLVRGSAR